MKVSVIIPVYNEEKVIGECLESLSKQSYKDLEIIAVDDGSTDAGLEPFYGWWGFNTGKIRWGEIPEETAKRELKEETGLTGTFTLKGIVHYHHIHKDGRFLEDKYFWIYRVENLKGKLKEKVTEGENIWMEEKDYRKLKNVFATFDEVSDVLNSKKLVYIDRVKVVDSY